MEDLVGLECCLISHGATSVDPVSQIIVRKFQVLGKRNFMQCPKCAQPAIGLCRVKIEVNTAQRLGAHIANSNGQKASLSIPIRKLEGGHRGVVKESFKA